MASLLRPCSPVTVLALAALAACGGSSNPPSPGTPGTGGGDTITGRERIGWVQPAQDATQLATFDYAIYVDGARSVLTGDTCAGSATVGSFDCSAPLPAMTPGAHTLELAAFVISDGNVLESDRSAGLRVTVAGSSAPAESQIPQQSTIVTSDGHRFRASVIARELDDPTDVATTPDGRVLIAERGGAVRIARADGLSPDPAVVLEVFADSPESGLTGLAVHPEFERTGYVYAAYAVPTRDGAEYLVSRFRERAGILGQHAVVAREPATSPDHAVVRFGSDGRLYLALPVGEDPRDAQDPGSSLGKLLRLNDDGTTPRDNPRASPVFSSGHRKPRALAWHPSSGVLWELEQDPEAGDELNVIVAGGDYGWPLARGASQLRGTRPAALVLPAGTDVAGAMFVPAGSNSPVAGELLVAARGIEDLLRIHTGPPGRPGLIEGMLQGRFGRIGAVHVSSDGTIYLTTANRGIWGPGRDLLIRMTAAMS